MDRKTVKPDLEDDGNEDYVIRVRGLPWSCTEQQLREFFLEEADEASEKIVAVHFTYNREGRPSGEAYLKFSDSESYESALLKDKEYLNKRYVEVFPSKQAEMEYVVRHSGKSSAYGGEANDDAVVRMRGLPYGCTKEEIASFFLGLEISPNGIVMLSDPRTGRATGEAFVQFVGKDTAEKALQKDMEKIGHRYIEVFRSSAEERRRFLRRTSDGTDGGASGFGNWSTDVTPPPLFSVGPMMGSASSSLFGPGYDSPEEMMYVGRSSRPTPYDRPQDHGFGAPRSRPVPLASAMPFGGSYGMRDFINESRGRLAGVGGYGGNSYKGYSEGGYGGAAGGGWRAGRTGTGSGPGHFVHMRGLPYSANKSDIVEFFSPLRIANVDFLLGDNGRPSGEANAEFYTHTDAVEAMKRDRDSIGRRYVELFLNSSNTSAHGSFDYKDFSRDNFM